MKRARSVLFRVGNYADFLKIKQLKLNRIINETRELFFENPDVHETGK